LFKIFFIFLITSILGFFTIWLKKDPGNIAISWYGWIIETSMPILILAFLSIFLLIYLIFIFIKNIYILPKNIKKQINKKRNNNAINNIVNAYSARGMGELELAKKYADKAKFLNKSPLKLLLDMEISKSYNEFDKNIFTEMMKHPETRLLAIKNITNKYFKENDILKAINAIKIIPKSKKTPDWFFYKLLQLYILDSDWDNVILSINHINKYTNISSKDYKKLQGKVYYTIGLDLFKKNNLKEALKNIDISLKYDPSFSSSIVLKSKIFYDNNPKEALNFIKSSWKNFSHPDIAILINDINSSKNKNYTLTLVKDIIKTGKNTFNNNLLLAKASINANSWKNARQALKDIPSEQWTKDIFNMMADIEKKENGNEKLSNEWKEKAALAKLDYIWGCTNCSHIENEWKIICPKCLSFDSIKWQQFKNSKFNQNIKLNNKNIKIESNNKKNNHENAARGILEDLSKGLSN